MYRSRDRAYDVRNAKDVSETVQENQPGTFFNVGNCLVSSFYKNLVTFKKNYCSCDQFGQGIPLSYVKLVKTS